MIETTACWLGGLWSDAEGASDVERSAAAKEHCHVAIHQAYGSEDTGRVERLRALDAVEVSELGAKVEAAARGDGLEATRITQLRALLNAVANAEREAMLARRAGDKVKDDIAVPKATAKRKADETAAADPLAQTRELDALLAADVGDLNHELRALGLLLAMDRLQFARGLPKHLKVLAVRGPMQTLFGVAAPELPPDPTRPPAGGAWLAYLTSLANAAGHPVPAQAHSLHDQELLAWGGTLMGFADKLRAEASAIASETQFPQVVEAVIRRLQTEYHADEAALLNAGTQAGAPKAQ